LLLFLSRLGVNLTNILQSAFASIFYWQKKLKIKTINTFKLEELFHRQKAARKMLVELKKRFYKH
jgi:hypothetical protein